MLSGLGVLLFILAMVQMKNSCLKNRIAPCLFTPKAIAYLTLQVNPALELALDKDNTVIDIKGLNDDSISLLADLEVKNKDYAQALKEITSEMVSRGFVKHTIISLFGDMVEAGLSESSALSVLTESIKSDHSLEELTTISAAVIDMHEAGIPTDTSLTLLSLVKEPGVDGKIFLQEITTLTSALIDAHEAGISEDAALDKPQESSKDVGDDEVIAEDKFSEVPPSSTDLKKQGKITSEEPVAPNSVFDSNNSEDDKQDENSKAVDDGDAYRNVKTSSDDD